MNWLAIQSGAQVSVERMLNALPEGLLVALFAWALLRVLRRQNSGTRFAVWFLALLTVTALPVLATVGVDHSQAVAGVALEKFRPAVRIPAHWAVFIFYGWAAGASAAMLRLVAGLWRLRQVRQSCVPIEADDLDPILQKTLIAIGASGLGISDRVTITTSDWVRVPAAIGFWKRTIVLPTWAWQELPANDLNVILLHEFAHLRRWDDWTNLIQKIVRALFFFHPAVWWIENRLSVEREMACDDAVLEQTANPRAYATCLVSLLEKSLAHRSTRNPARRWSLAHAVVDRAREATLRLAQILDTNRPVATGVWKPAMGIASLFALACLLVLPLAPKFIAFDRGATAGTMHPANLAASNHSVMQTSGGSAAAISAALRTGESPSLAPARVTHARSTVSENVNPALAAGRVRRRSLQTAPPVDVVAASLRIPQSPERLLEASANADREIAPQFQTLVLVEATRYGTPQGPVWSVQVWQLTLVSTAGGPRAGVPVASKI